MYSYVFLCIFMYFYVFLCTKLAWPFVLVNYMDLLSFLDFMLSTARIDVRDAMKPGDRKSVV